MQCLRGNTRLVILLTLAVLGQSATADVIHKYDGTKVDGNLLEIQGSEIVFKSSTDPDAKPLNIAHRDLNVIHFRGEEWNPQWSRLLIDHRGDTKSDHSGTIKLRAGKHRFGLMYWKSTGPTSLIVEMSGPGMDRKSIPGNQLFRPAANSTETHTSQGFDAEGFLDATVCSAFESGALRATVEWPAFEQVHDYSEIKGGGNTNYGIVPELSLKTVSIASHFGVILYGFIEVPTDGEYTLFLTTESSAVLWLGRDPQCAHPFNANLQAGDYRVTSGDGGDWWGKLSAWTPEKLSINLPIGGGQFVIVETPQEMLHEIWAHAVVLKQVQIDRTNEPGTLDSIYVRVGEESAIQRVSGQVLGIEGDSLQVQHNGEKRGLKLDRVLGVVFQGRRGQPQSSPGLLSIVGGSRIPGQLMRVEHAKEIVFKTAWGQDITIPYAHAVRINVRNGRTIWLTDLTPTAEEVTPYFDRASRPTVNKSLTGSPLRIGEIAYSHGLCTHSRTVLTYGLNGEYDRFQCDLGLQHDSGQQGHVDVRVLTDGEVAYQMADLKLASGLQNVSVDLTGRKKLTLEVDFGLNFDVGDHVTWGDAKLVRKTP